MFCLSIVAPSWKAPLVNVNGVAAIAPAANAAKIMFIARWTFAAAAGRAFAARQPSSMKRVAVTGPSGFVGRAIVSLLAKRGDSVLALGRSKSPKGFPASVRTARFDPNDPTPH